MSHWDSVKRDSHLSIENSRFTTENAWFEILASLLRMCESWFWHPTLKMKSGILVFLWDSKISYSHLAVENVNWHSHGPTEKGWIVIPMLLYSPLICGLRQRDLWIKAKRSAPTPLPLIARMSRPLPPTSLPFKLLSWYQKRARKGVTSMICSFKSWALSRNVRQLWAPQKRSSKFIGKLRQLGGRWKET